MKNLVGNSLFRVFLKGTEKSVDGILIDTDDKYDYVQRESSVFVIPKHNVLYYETNQLSQTSKVIASVEEKSLAVFIDKSIVAKVKVPHDLDTKELIEFLYSNQTIQDALKGKKQKSLECFDDAVYILTDQHQETIKAEVVFNMDEKSPINTYLSPVDMVKRLNNGTKRKQQ